jgi:uncharacterized membrane protein
MIMAEMEDAGTRKRIVVRPTHSLSARATLALYLVVCAVTLAVNVGFYFSGAWLVIPFSGLELAVFGAALWVVWNASKRVEIITIDDDHVHVVQQRRRATLCKTFQRYWAKVILSRDRRDGYPSRLFIRSHGQTVELGAFLTNEEREELSNNLSNSINNQRGV